MKIQKNKLLILTILIQFNPKPKNNVNSFCALILHMVSSSISPEHDNKKNKHLADVRGVKIPLCKETLSCSTGGK